MIKTTVTKRSRLFDRPTLRAALASAVSRSAKTFKEATRLRMVRSKPAGKVYQRGAEGRSFTRAHRASKVGQRPAVETTTLINALQDIRTNDSTIVVDVADKVNPVNNVSASVYADRLQAQMGRAIMTNEDRRLAQIEMTYRLREAVKRLL